MRKKKQIKSQIRRQIKKHKKYDWGQKLQSGVIGLALVVLFFLCLKKVDASSFLLQETLPGFSLAAAEEREIVMAAPRDENTNGISAPAADMDEVSDRADLAEPLVEIAEIDENNKIDPLDQADQIDQIDLIEDNPFLLAVEEVLGASDIQLQPETDPLDGDWEHPEESIPADMDLLRDLNYLRTRIYTVAAATDISAKDFDADQFMAADLRIDNAGGDGSQPKILIFHTHSCEMYLDSDANDVMDGIMGVGERLARILTERYDIPTLHHLGRYDLVNGKNHILGAYERMEPEVSQILRDNPSIEVAIDLHRDGVPENRKLITAINGAQMATVMFFNGLSQQKTSAGLKPLENLPNPYLATNLALSFQAQMAANQMFPGFTRKIYLNAYRYSLNMLPKSMLIEVGAQTNTKEEAMNAMEPLAMILANVLLN
jgi:stage II sporulation protein P